MTKKEKIISIYLTLSMFLLITSCIFTLYQNKPKNQNFEIEIFINKILK
ncbi:MAG: hypothetical protein IKR34_01940 [Candidatus Gastranaerophilales bacterium]|nr:hypothetical protein [Candidatus Gastranaerophilales bacterium]